MNTCVFLGRLQKALLQPWWRKKIPLNWEERGQMAHLLSFGCDHRGTNLKIIFSQVPQQSTGISPTRKEFINAKLFLADQIHLKSNTLAQGTSVGLMTRGGTHCPGHSQRLLALLKDQETLGNSPALRPWSDKEWSIEIWFLFPLVENSYFRR